MPAPAWEDLDAFLNVDEFAITATVSLQDGTTRAVRGIFDDPYLNAELGEYELDTNRPRLNCKESDVLGVARGDVVEIDGQAYDVLSAPHSDGAGMAMLEMARQQ